MTATHDPSEVAADAVAAGEPTSLPSAGGIADGVAATLLQGSAVGKAGVGFGAELARITLGRSEVSPQRSDWRFKDPTWSTNLAYKRLAQVYLAACEAVDKVVDDIELNGPGHRADRARFVDGDPDQRGWRRPTSLLGNPAALEADVRDRGRQPAARRAELGCTTCAHNGGMPSMADARRSAGRRGPGGDPGRGRLPRRASPS